MCRVMAVPSITVSSTASSASFVPIPINERTSPRDDGGEGEEANVADDTIIDAPPVESPRLGQREQDPTPTRHGLEPGRNLKANLGNHHVGTPQNHRPR